MQELGVFGRRWMAESENMVMHSLDFGLLVVYVSALHIGRTSMERDWTLPRFVVAVDTCSRQDLLYVLVLTSILCSGRALVSGCQT